MAGRFENLCKAAAPPAFIVAALVVTGIALADQAGTFRVDRALRAYAMGMETRTTLQGKLDRQVPCAALTSHERLLVVAVARTTLARQMTGSSRDRQLIEATDCADAAVRKRPGSAAALVVRASVLDGRGPRFRAQAARDFARSYAAAPYLRHQALWRMRYGAANWSSLSDTTRQAMLREAEWFARIGPNDRAQTFNALGNGAPAARLAVRLAYDAELPR